MTPSADVYLIPWPSLRDMECDAVDVDDLMLHLSQPQGLLPDELTVLGSRSSLPLGFRFLNVAGRSLRTMHLPMARLDEETVLEAAVKETGLTDFGAPYFREGLLRLLESAEEDAALHFVGRLAYRETIVNSLVNRLLLTEARRRTPEVFQRPLVPPIIVLGLPRSGTTFLHRLLALDPMHRGVPLWELVRPLPDGRSSGVPDRRREIFQRKLKSRQRVLFDLDCKHYTRADTPEECLWLLAATFLSPAFWVLGPVYGYLEWYKGQDRLQSYREYRLFLQVLQKADPTRRLALKAPTHIGALEVLLKTVPEALLIQTHRNPVEASNSLNSLFYSLHSGMTERLDVRRMAEANLSLQEHEIALNLAARDAYPNALFDVYYDRLVADPIGTVRGIYAYYELAWSEEFEQRLISYMQQNPRGKHGPHRYAPEDFGQTDEAIAERFTAYSERFGFTGLGTTHD